MPTTVIGVIVAPMSTSGSDDYRAAFHSAPLGIALFDDELRVTTVNPSLCLLLGRPEEELVGHTVEASTHADDWLHDRGRMQLLLTGAASYQQWEKRFVDTAGTPFWCRVSASPVRDASGTPVALVAQIEDISERRDLERELRQLTLHDPLTGLPNRRLLIDRIERALEDDLTLVRPPAVLFLDLDRFTLINDSLGRQVGDAVLLETARRLESVVRPGDTVGRVGGDKFVVLVEDVADAAEVEALADRLERVVSRPIEVGGDELVVTMSVGIRVATRGTTAESLVSDADTAMSRAKKSGRARSEIFTAGLRALAVDRFRRETTLRQAVAEKRLAVEFQPVVSLADGALHSFEALVRLRATDGSLIAPAEFLSEAEETGLIVPVGQWVLDESCRLISSWRARGIASPSLLVKVNVSARQLVRAEFAESVLETLRRHGTPSYCLNLELTESMLLDAGGATLDQLRRLADAGVSLGIDDFGTGWSSLSYLKRLPLRFLKIDRSFIDGITRDSGDSSIVSAIISIGRALNLVVVSEGVEQAEQAEILRGMGCHLGQGWHFGYPRGADQVEAALPGWRTGAPIPAHADRLSVAGRR